MNTDTRAFIGGLRGLWPGSGEPQSTTYEFLDARGRSQIRRIDVLPNGRLIVIQALGKRAVDIPAVDALRAKIQAARAAREALGG